MVEGLAGHHLGPAAVHLERAHRRHNHSAVRLELAAEIQTRKVSAPAVRCLHFLGGLLDLETNTRRVPVRKGRGSCATALVRVWG